MTRVVSLGVFFTFASWSFGAEPVPRLEQIAEQQIKALGGPAALEKASALVLSGDCKSTAEGKSGTIQILVSSPRVTFNLNDGALRIGFSGHAGWRHVAGHDLQQHPGRQFVEIVTVFDQARVRWWKEWYPNTAVTGIQKVEGRDAYALSVNPGYKASETIFVDQQTGPVVRMAAPVPYTYNFKDVKSLSGIEAAQLEPR